jgi:hypothetical protein
MSSGDLLSRSPVHAGGRDGVGYDGGASRKRWQNPNTSHVSSQLQIAHDSGAARTENPLNTGSACRDEEERACITPLLTRLLVVEQLIL